MIKILSAIVLLFVSYAVQAQNIVTGLYDEMCDPLQAVFCDYVREASETRYISNRQGEYIGTLIDNEIYGWGFYLSVTGAQSFGQYRKGKLIFGLQMSGDIAKVGGEDNYVVYDLYTGDILRIHTLEGDVPLSWPYVSSDERLSSYTFKKEIYSNGDIFYGEFCNGKRNGYGVYCWVNGDMWYGRYKDGYRNGYGMLIKPDHMIYYGKWVGDSKVE